MKVISWSTKKTQTGFMAVVYSVAHNAHKVLSETSGFKTRARAATYAKKNCKYFSAVEKRQAA